MAFQFPNTPLVGDTILNPTSSQFYTWNGIAWVQYPVTASQAVTSSYSLTSSFSQTASYALQALSSSFATTASLAQRSISSSFAASSSIAQSTVSYLLQAAANVTYTLPALFTADPCRYSIVESAVNMPSSWFNTASYVFTPQKAGYWEINCGYDLYRGNLAETNLAINRNGFVVAAGGGFGLVSTTLSKIVYLNGTTDNVQIINYGNTANSRAQTPDRSFFQARWVG